MSRKYVLQILQMLEDTPREQSDGSIRVQESNTIRLCKVPTRGSQELFCEYLSTSFTHSNNFRLCFYLQF